MAGVIRVVVRTLLATVWTFVLFLMLVPCTWAASAFPRAGVPARRAIVRLWGKGTLRILGVRLVLNGTAPQPPFLLVTNHVSHIDGYVIAALLGCLFVGKSEVASWPIFGVIARAAGVIFVNRAKRSDTLPVNERIGKALERGNGIAMFSEGTTSRGSVIQPFKPALFESAIQHRIPVHYATIHYQAPEGQPPASEWICWWDGFPYSFGRHLLGVLWRPGFTATVTFGPEAISAPDRKTLANRLWQASSQQFTPIE